MTVEDAPETDAETGTEAGTDRTARACAAAAWVFSLLTAVIPAAWALDASIAFDLLVYPEQVAGAVLGLAGAGVFMRSAAKGRGPGRWADVALAAGALWLGGHVWVRFPVLSEGAFFHPEESGALGILALVVCVEGLRRVAGWALAVVLSLMIAYTLFADLIPGRLQGRPMPGQDVLGFLGTDSTAMLGAPLQVAVFVVILFVLFGRLLVATGGAEALTDAARGLAGDRRGATAKMAVIASGFMGSISGSAVSNVMTTGVVTIPAMRRAGFSAERAGAIEAVASTGGQIMPPVMGAAAFLMAEFLAIPYTDVLIAALIPAVLYFMAVYLQIALLAEKNDIGGIDDPAAPWRTVLPRLIPVVVPMAVLLVCLFTFNMPAPKAVVWASGSLALIGLAGAGGTRLTLAGVLRAVVETGRDASQIVLVCAIAGMVIGLVQASGLSFGLGFVLVQLGQGSLLALLGLTALVSIVLGMGLPTSGVYLLLASLAAPPLVQLGIGGLEAHFFVLYFGLMSMITPPVALAAFAAASVSGAGAMGTAVQAVRFGWIAFILPFVFVFQPGLLMQGAAVDVVLAAAGALIAVPLVTAALVGWGRRTLSLAERALCLLVGVFAILPHGPSLWLDMLTWGAMALGVAMITVHVRGTAEAAAPAE